MLIGRETETAGLGRLLDAAHLGTATGFRATGIEYEADLPYAVLQIARLVEAA